MMKLNRSNYIIIFLTLATTVNNEIPPPKESSHTCPFSKIIEDIFKLNKNMTRIPGTSEKEKLILHSIANMTNNKDITEDELINVIITAINNIKTNLTKDSAAHKMNEAIIVAPNNTTKNIKVTQIKSGIEEKNDVTNDIKSHDLNNKKNVTEKPSYVEILTIEPNNTKSNNNTSHNIVEVLKNLMPMFNNTQRKGLHNITIIESNINRNHSFTTSKNVSTIILTYCDHNKTDIAKGMERETDTKEGAEDYDYYAGVEEENEEELKEGENKEVLEAAEYGMQKMHELYSILEPKLYSLGLWLDEGNPARYVAAFNAPSEDASRYTRYGYATLQAAAKLKELTSSNGDVLESRTEDVQFPSATALRQSPLMQHCPLKGAPKCPPASKRYRTHDGTCNNVHRPRWGSTMTPVQRFLPPSYSDGLQAPRRSVFGSKLPSAREISAMVHESKNVESPGITHLLMQWGQFLDHDVTSSSQSRGFNGSVPRCCKDGGRDFVSKELMHPECFPIPVPSSDPFYGPRGVRCLDFVRSSPAPRDDCSLGWREQLNQVSAYIDGSPLYGSSARQSDKLRLFRNGMLQYGRVQQRRPILPPERGDELCRGGALSTDCFKSGDARVNEHPGLVAAHIVWLRQHNRMAQELAHLNPQWSDEKIYQETRKIVGAMIQHITYKEFLPIVLGSDVMEIFELEPLKKSYYKQYNPKINASPASSFGSAAFRFGHSLVQPSMMRYDRFHRPIHNNVSLHNEMTNPSNIWSMGAVDRLLLGMLNQPIQKRDEFITEELTNHLFQTPKFDFGMDLAAINIQRGRDHGVPPYTSFREPCGLSEITEFEDLLKVMPARAVRKLKLLYRTVEDIDLFTGGMAERPVVGGLVGPTFACIIAQQFSNLRKGDRFWYENGGLDNSFTPAQLQQVRRISLAQVLCRTLDTIDIVQPFVFLSHEHPDNDRISCQNGRLNNFDLSPWIEIDSESNNDIQKSEKLTTERPKRTKPTTAKPTTPKTTTTTKKNQKTTNKSTRKPQIDLTKNFTVTAQKLTQTLNDTTDDDTGDLLNLTLNVTSKEDDSRNMTLIDKSSKTDVTIQIDDKLDFKNKTKRLDDIDISYRNKPNRKYSEYDYDDDDTQSVQSVVVNNAHQRPYNYKRPVLTVTENTNKYTYLINYVPRPTESYRQTTRRHYDRDRDVVKVTYQTYDDTYRRPNKPYYYNRQDSNDNNYRYNIPTRRRTTIHDFFSSARSNDDTEHTTTRSRPNQKTDDFDMTKTKTDDKLTMTDKPKNADRLDVTKHDQTDVSSTTTKDMYKLVTFSYVGSYRGDMDEISTKTDKNDKSDLISKDFSTYTAKPTSDKTDGFKLSTFYLHDTTTKAYNQRSTRRNDDDLNNKRPDKYYFINNAFRHTDTTTTEPTLKADKDIIKENYNSPGHPVVEIEERSSLDNMPNLDHVEGKAAANKFKIPAKPAQTPSVAFQIIPSEISPSHWAVYDEDISLPEEPNHRMPPIKTDPHALKEIPRPIKLGLRRRRPGF